MLQTAYKTFRLQVRARLANLPEHEQTADNDARRTLLHRVMEDSTNLSAAFDSMKTSLLDNLIEYDSPDDGVVHATCS